MQHPRVLIIALLATVLCASAPATGLAQLGSLKKKAEEAAKKKLEEAAKKVAADSAKKADSVKKAASDGAKKADSTKAPGGAPKADPKIWENYDFVPGNKVLFYTDFSEDRVGNFARGLRYRSGPAEIVDRDGVKVLRATGPTEFLIPLGRKLPQRFTLELDVIPPPAASGGFDLVSVEGGAASDRGERSVEIEWNVAHQALLGGGQGIGTSQQHLGAAETKNYLGQLTHLRILMDSAYFKMYANERRLYNMPELAFKRDSVIRVRVRGGENADAVFLTGIRVAESETDVMYDALLAKGRWVTQGILFATGKAELQQESRPVLKEIAGTLKQHGDLKILIEGHTDNVGAPAANLALSDARAAAVKKALVSEYGIDGSRLTTQGFGDTKPAVANATAAGRAQNRRVEIVKQ